jgi:hypothetical protein
MRGLRGLAAGLVLSAAVGAVTDPASAQSLLQRMFGYGAPRSPSYQLRPPATPFSTPSPGASEGWQEDLTPYRTLCVRMCDGFYYPMSNGVRRERLYRDNRACMQGCDGEARLFYYPTTGGSVETMVDLAGRSYASLPNAFRYRKTLVEGCACKPAPWSAEEAARHQGYAAGEGTAVAGVPAPRRAHPDAIAGLIEGESALAAEGDATGPRTAASDVYMLPPRPIPASRPAVTR